ncbi:MAG TPA: hypothetical protein VLM75_15520 [Spirochaetota bacterium]|nr:hypothetical protein [Spirochaetota bacterium]
MNTILIIILMVILFILAWALFGSDDQSSKTPGEGAQPEALLRRRASDREIEEKFPDRQAQPLRRKSDLDSLEHMKDISGEFKLPYLTDEIITETSGFRVYRRTLINAEIYAKKGDFATATSLYEGVVARINDLETNHKIEANIEYLRRYREFLSARKKKDDLIEAASPRKSHELKLSLDGPLTIPDRIQIGITAPAPAAPAIDIDQIAEQISRKLNLAGPAAHADEAELNRYRDEVNRLDRRLNDLSGDLAARRAAEEVYRRPTIIEAKYESPVPFILDPKPILELLEKLPARRSPETGDDAGKTSPSGKQRLPSGAAALEEREEFRKETVTRDEKESPDEWELLSKYGRDEEQPAENLSDEDIFEKIISEGAHKRKDDVEILGDSRPADELEYDARDRDLELKKEDDARFYRKFLQHNRRKARELPILKVSYDFSKLPDEFSLAREKNILEYSYYKYKPMLERAAEYLKKRKVKDAINYYKVVMSQNIPPEFKTMIRKNIGDLTEYLEKYLTTD